MSAQTVVPLVIVDSDGGGNHVHISAGAEVDVLDTHDFLESRSVYGTDYCGTDYISYVAGLQQAVTQRRERWSAADQHAADQVLTVAVDRIRRRYGSHMLTDRYLTPNDLERARALDLLPR